ncbi:MAG: hypothetical protein K6E78_05055 [Treponema sp.]|nr:hypothetical protein [Treponema sp.]
MKMTKKILLGAAALVAALAFVGCGAKDDDTNLVDITGKGNSYAIDFTNETDAAMRGYKPTALKHAGGLVKITIDESSSDPSTPVKAGGVMGFIFDLKDNADNKDAKDFFIIGVRKGGYYVSKFTGVTNLQAYNFGYSNKEDNTKADGTVEKEYKEAFQAITLPTDANGNPYVYVYAFGNNDGSFSWKILNASATEKVKSLSDKEFSNLDFTSDMILAEGTIPAEDTGYDKQTQNKLAVYANVYAQGTLIGNWDFVGTYKEAEIDE